MHEVSIAQSLLDIAVRECKMAGYKKVNSISLLIGEASGVQIDSLRFAFDIIKKGTLAEDAELLITISPLTGKCVDCATTFYPQGDIVFECPNCKGNNFRMIKGNELDIVEIDVD